MKKTRPVVSTKQLIPSIRHQGYHTIYALAELIDNSIQADATNIKILCMDKVNEDTRTRQLLSIAVYDDGSGMSKDVLWDSIRLGESQNRGKDGIGRFGVGLTHASFSQCSKIDVYSWKKPKQVYHVMLDLCSLDGESDGIEVEEPEYNKIPNSWKKALGQLPPSGTLVVWSNLDRVRWKKAETLIKNSQFTLGRIYRKFIAQNKLNLRLVAFDGETGSVDRDEQMLPNDPLYLMNQSSTPPPWNNKPMFQPDGERYEEKTPIKSVDGKKYDVVTRYSFVKKEAREGTRNAGKTPHGQHAANNLGVSILRANRELSLDTNMIISYDPVERWWGAEIEFPPALDEIFGVSSNKQTASELIHVMKLVGKQNRDQQSKEDLEGEEDNPLFQLVSRMSLRIRGLRQTLPKPKPPKGSGRMRPGPNPPKPNYPTVTDAQIASMSQEERKKVFQKLMKHLGIKGAVWRQDEELRFEHVPLTGSQFFDVSLVGGIMVVTVNTNHRAYTSLLALLSYPEERKDSKLELLLNNATEGFQKFLAAWASLENKTLNPDERKVLGDLRYEWGKILEDYFKVNE